MPKCTVNGKQIEVKPGTSIIEAFKEAGENIAHYCWHPGLSVAGVCRLCMVEIEGNPRLQIACNTMVQEGMVVSNQSDKVKDAVRWGLDFHLINHPLDCPICDQAGECGLQEQYMEFGKYEPEMAERKVKKRKVVDLGPKVVLDSERCILCSRCVRFTDEVTKTRELGIFNRGDRSEIGTFKDRPLDNNYSLNTVDICPVGALTSRDFRFRQRVWYLKNKETICTGCSTGCNVKAYYNEDGLFRVKPVHNEDINGYWMCDEGRDIYKFANPEFRLKTARKGTQDHWDDINVVEAAKSVGSIVKTSVDTDGAGSVAVVLTGQHSNEEYDAILEWINGDLKVDQVYHWVNNPEKFDDFDGLLLRGDRNPNTKGLLERLDARKLNKTWQDFETKLKAGTVKVVIVVGPENPAVYSDMGEKVQLINGVDKVVWMSACPVGELNTMTGTTWQIPLKTFVEKPGTYVNFQGRAQTVKPVTFLVKQALSVVEAVQLMAGEASKVELVEPEHHPKKNYFVYSRGPL
ncbi:MAG: (2Fe-2S)-binding protein [Pseudobdellovibrionaceae bacterium]|nr:MAG: (2Fe-2S)-binding protein [Pseudobdellovibrionaceae bacterium]